MTEFNPGDHVLIYSTDATVLYTDSLGNLVIEYDDGSVQTLNDLTNVSKPGK